MNNKASSVNKKKYDDKEDLRIRNVAYLHTGPEKAFFCIFLILFGITLGTMCLSIRDFINSRNNKGSEVLTIDKDKYKITIVNNTIEEDIDLEQIMNDDERVIDKIDYLEIENKSDTDKIFKYDIRLDIKENGFKKNLYSDINGDVLVRFSYSDDKNKWTYTKNSISTSDSVLNVLMGYFYDVGGIKDNIKVLTNHELEVEAHSKKTIYWRMELYYQNRYSNNTHSKFSSLFKIDVNEID